MDIIQDFIKSQGDSLKQTLTEKLGFGGGQADGFLNGMLGKVVGMISGGKFDIGDLLGGGGASSIADKLDFEQLAGETGVTTQQAKDGVNAVAPKFVDFIKDKTDDPGDLLGLLGGDKEGALGSLGKLAGGFFGKK